MVGWLAEWATILSENCLSENCLSEKSFQKKILHGSLLAAVCTFLVWFFRHFRDLRVAHVPAVGRARAGRPQPRRLHRPHRRQQLVAARLVQSQEEAFEGEHEPG